MVRIKCKLKSFVTKITAIFVFYKNNLLYQSNFFISEYFNSLEIIPLLRYAGSIHVCGVCDAPNLKVAARKEQGAVQVAFPHSPRKKTILNNLFNHNTTWRLYDAVLTLQ